MLPQADAARETPTGEGGRQRIADRYLLRGLLGRGGYGEVWEAEDTLGQTLVAIKLPHSDAGTAPFKVRKEVSALRLLRIPGVVQMLDEGLDEGRPFLVMERVSGTPFPGPMPRTWLTLESTALALVETLERVHAAGVVHRDIKPTNVLVDERGIPTLLDFGVSQSPSLARESNSNQRLVGTPAYLAPEQFLGEPLTPATDLYALGVMLYETLAGRLPHETTDLQTLMRLRLTEMPERIEAFVPDLPTGIADTIHALLAREPKERPQSAHELLERLRDRNAPASDPRGTFYGDRIVLRTLLGAVHAGRAMDLVGKSGSGRTHTLQEFAALLENEGIEFVWAIPGKRAFSSLDNVLKVPHDTSPRTLEITARLVDQELGILLKQGCVILADDESRLDRHSRAALLRVRSEGPVIRALTLEDGSFIKTSADAIVLEAWTETRTRSLFVQEDRIFHLCEDAAHELHVRSGGWPARIFRELRAWERAGLVQKIGSQWQASREALHHLAASRMALPSPATRTNHVNDAMVQTLPRGAEGRLFHLIASPSADLAEIAAETLAVVEPWVLQGSLGQATAVLVEGLRATQQEDKQDTNESTTRLLEWLVELAIADGSPRALDVALYELCRVTQATPNIEALAQLVRAALAMRTVAGKRAISLIDDIAAFSNPNLERRRQQIRVHAARRCSLDEEQTALEEAECWARNGDDLARARYSGWLGRLRYRQGRFDEAAELHADAAKHEGWPTERIAALLNAASALLEAFRFDDAVHTANEVQRLSAQCRHAYGEARAEWLIRTARYRRGDALDVDEAFVDLAAKTGVLDLEALAGLTESAIAWRRGDMERTARLARRTEQRWTTMGKTWGALFARTLVVVATKAIDEWERLVEGAIHSPVSGAGIQMLGLLVHVCPARAHELLPAMSTLRTAIPEYHWGLRMDVMSVNEAWQSVHGQTF